MTRNQKPETRNTKDPYPTYGDAVAFLNAAVNHERMIDGSSRYTLARMRRFDRAVGAPHRGRNVIHIAGTKGKGSTAHFIEALLRDSGYRTGLYTSPHLLDLRERIRLDGRPISRERFRRIMNRIAPAMRRFRPTYFEILTEVALQAFVDCDWIVLEVGLGGRLDATNIVRPRLCVITPISLDHTDRLGTTVEAIARDKAGIVKRGVPVVTAATGRALAALPNRAIPSGTRGVPKLSVLGAHQRVNAGLALQALRTLGLPMRPEALAGVRLPGRAQWVGGNPPFIVDGCHNVASARALARVLRRFRGRPRTLIFAAAADKDVEAMLAALLPEAEKAVFTRYRSPRAMAPAALASIAARRGGRRIFKISRPQDAIKFVINNSSRREIGVSAGSYYLAGEVIAELRRNGRKDATGV